MAVVFALETLAEAWNDAETLLFANHAESGMLPQAEFAPDKERYFEIEKTGMFRVFTARDAGRLVGYSVVFVSTHLHYRNTKFASPDVLFVHPDYRGSAAVRFILWSDQQLRAEGVQYIYRHISHKRDYSRTLQRMGYELVELGYGRKL